MYSRIAVSSRPPVDTKYPRAQKLCSTKFYFRSPHIHAKWIAPFPFINPISWDTAYFGGIKILMCTGPDTRCPSSMWLFFCSDKRWNTSSQCFRRLSYRPRPLHLGINTTGYLHFHFAWLKLLCSSLRFLLSVSFASHERGFFGWTPASVKRQSTGSWSQTMRQQ